MKSFATQILLAGGAMASAMQRAKMMCPQVHVFGARETTVPDGLGSAGPVVQMILDAFPGSTSEVIDYPATGGDTYAASVAVGIAAVVNQTTTFSNLCPSTKMVMVGYSQGSQIMDTAFCGGPDGASLTNATIPMPVFQGMKVAAMIWMGNPRYIGGLPYNVGTATLGGFAARPAGFVCQFYSSIIQSYCDSPDPFCSQGNDTLRHQAYGQIYGQDALQFVINKLATDGIMATLPVPAQGGVEGIGPGGGAGVAPGMAPLAPGLGGPATATLNTPGPTIAPTTNQGFRPTLTPTILPASSDSASRSDSVLLSIASTCAMLTFLLNY